MKELIKLAVQYSSDLDEFLILFDLKDRASSLKYCLTYEELIKNLVNELDYNIVKCKLEEELLLMI